MDLSATSATLQQQQDDRDNSPTFSIKQIAEGFLTITETSVELTVLTFPPGSPNIPEDSRILVSYVPNKMDDLSFSEMFAEIGTVLEANIVRDLKGESKGYGFVSFEKMEHARFALRMLNGKEIMSKRIKIVPARAWSPGYGKGSVYIKGLSTSWTVLDLFRHFNNVEIGSVTNCKLLLKDGVNTGTGFVDFATRELADLAISHHQNVIPPSQLLPLTLLRSRKAKSPSSSPVDIPTTSMPPGATSGINSGSSSSSASVELYRPPQLRNRADSAGRKKQQPNIPYILEVSNITRTQDAAYLRAVFSQYGAVVDTKVTLNGSDVGGGKGEVMMFDGIEAFCAAQELNGFQILPGKWIFVGIRCRNQRP